MAKIINGGDSRISSNLTEAMITDNLLANETTQNTFKERILIKWNNIHYEVKVPLKLKKKGSSNSVASAPSMGSYDLSKNSNSISPDGPTTQKIILNNIEGYALPNEVLAIMGPSGCGKTTLLNIIAHRQLPQGANHTITKNVKANNLLLDDSNFGKICAYVMQDDILMDCLTPRECLYFGAKLRLKEKEKVIIKIVDNLIDQVIN